MNSITPNQKKQFKRFVEDATDKALKEVGLDKDALQRLLENGGKFQADIVASIKKHSAQDERFKLINTFKLTVPASYNHVTQLTSFSKENYKKFSYYNDALTDENFAKATNKLVPGKTYTAKIFQLTTEISSEDCVMFLKTQKAILVGAQGISLVWQKKKNELPIGKWTVSFDEKDALFVDAGGCHRVSGVYRRSSGAWNFLLGCFEDAWDTGFCLLCFCDCE